MKAFRLLKKLLLIVRCVDINGVRDSQSMPLLHHAAFDHHECLEVLLRTGKADVNVVDGNGRTALHVAAGEDSPDILKLLLEHGQPNLGSVDSVYGRSDACFFVTDDTSFSPMFTLFMLLTRTLFVP